MKKGAIVSVSIIVVIGLAAFSFSNKKTDLVKETITESQQPDTSKKLIDLEFVDFEANKNEQSLFFNIRGRFNGTTTKSRLAGSKLIQDFVSGYPTEWVSDYVSVKMIINKDDNEHILHSSNDTLTKEQRELINSLAINDNISIEVEYKSENAATNKIELRNMEDISLVVVPEFEAMPVFGYDILIQYLEENSFDEIPDSIQNKIDRLVINFRINEKGEIENTTIEQSSGFAEVDQLILELTNSMQKWTPAEDINEKAVFQEFVLSLRNWQDGC